MSANCAARLDLEVELRLPLLRGFGRADGSSKFTLTLDGIDIEMEALVTRCDISNTDLISGQPALAEDGVSPVVKGDQAVPIKKVDVADMFRNIDL